MTTKLTAQLFCLHCNKETEHTITYKDKNLEDVKCNVCGNEIRINRKKLLENYTVDFLDRIFTKPHRLTEEIKRDLSHFLKSIPIRILTKPYRVVHELSDILHEDK